MHKNMAGKRQSDHIALLIAFQQWLNVKWQGETAEKEFCERKALNIQTMRMTYEARNQLKDIMLYSGFPEECLYENKKYDIFNNDPNLDVLTSLLCYALYPNVCFHTDKRKVITCDGNKALIHKNSVNCGKEIQAFPSPFFVFGEKIKTRAVSAKQMTMVTPLQLLLFASDKVETVSDDPNMICLDNWINLKIDRAIASNIIALRIAMDTVLASCTTNQSQITNRPEHIKKFVNTIQMLSDQNNFHITFSKIDSINDLGKLNLRPASFNNCNLLASDNIHSSNSSLYEPSFKRFAQGDPNNFDSFDKIPVKIEERSSPMHFRHHNSSRGGYNSNNNRYQHQNQFNNNRNYNNRKETGSFSSQSSNHNQSQFTQNQNQAAISNAPVKPSFPPKLLDLPATSSNQAQQAIPNAPIKASFPPRPLDLPVASSNQVQATIPTAPLKPSFPPKLLDLPTTSSNQAQSNTRYSHLNPPPQLNDKNSEKEMPQRFPKQNQNTQNFIPLPPHSMQNNDGINKQQFNRYFNCNQQHENRNSTDRQNQPRNFNQNKGHQHGNFNNNDQHQNTNNSFGNRSGFRKPGSDSGFSNNARRNYNSNSNNNSNNRYRNNN